MSSLKKLPPLPKCLWTISRDGVDFGPYRSEEVLEGIANSEILATTALVEQHTGLTIQTEEIRAFAQACSVAARARDAAQLAQESDAHFTEIRQEQRLKPILFALLVILVAIGIWQFWNLDLATNQYETAYASPLSAVPPLSAKFTALTPPRSEQASTIQTAASSRKNKTSALRKRRRTTRARRSKGKKSPLPTVASRADPEGSTQEFDFSDEEAGGADDNGVKSLLPLSPVEVQRVRSMLRPRFRQCFRKQAEHLPPGSYGVRVVLRRSGKFSTPTLEPNIKDSSALQSCLRMVTGLVKARPFSGPTQTVQGHYLIGGL